MSRFSDIDPSLASALDALDAESLRALIAELVPWMEGEVRDRLLNQATDRAARQSSNWTPEAPTDVRTNAIEHFMVAAEVVGYAEPVDVDAALREGSHAYLARKYERARRILGAVLRPLADGSVHIGQHETVDEMLSVDVDACAAQYFVACYLTADPDSRAQRVLDATDDAWGMGWFHLPLRRLQEIALDPLPDFQAFKEGWRRVVEKKVGPSNDRGWDRKEDGWLREVVLELDGTDGLGGLARKRRETSYLRAWCDAVQDSGDWTATLASYVEAVELADDDRARGEFLDGAALACIQLNSHSVPHRLELAWRAAPTFGRLVRWLDTAPSEAVLTKWTDGAIASCPDDANRQRALLHVLRGEYQGAATLLAEAGGLGWSRDHHPGHLAFPAFLRLLGLDVEIRVPRSLGEFPPVDDARPRLPAPEPAALLDKFPHPMSLDARGAITLSLRRAAEKRLEGVTEHKRRRHYGHAAKLAVLCARAEGTAAASAWLADVRAGYRRFSALQREFRALES